MILIRTDTVPYDDFGRVLLENGTSLSKSHLGRAYLWDVHTGMAFPVTRSLDTNMVTFCALKGDFSGNSTP